MQYEKVIYNVIVISVVYLLCQYKYYIINTF